MRHWVSGILVVVLLISVAGCAPRQTKTSLLDAMLEKVYELESYQLEADMEIGGQIYQVRQWFLAPDKLRTVMYQSTGLEQIVVSVSGSSVAYYSATREWVSLGKPNTGPFPWGMPLLLLLAEMAKENTTISDTFSSVKLVVKAQSGWDNCEVVISKRTGLPESCTLVKGTDSVKLRVNSLVLNPRLAEDLFRLGR